MSESCPSRADTLSAPFVRFFRPVQTNDGIAQGVRVFRFHDLRLGFSQTRTTSFSELTQLITTRPALRRAPVLEGWTIINKNPLHRCTIQIQGGQDIEI